MPIRRLWLIDPSQEVPKIVGLDRTQLEDAGLAPRDDDVAGGQFEGDRGPAEFARARLFEVDRELAEVLVGGGVALVRGGGAGKHQGGEREQQDERGLEVSNRHLFDRIRRGLERGGAGASCRYSIN
jgi:hypothetical protein